MVKKIKFNISSTGEVNLSVEGVQGSSCEELSRPFEEVLGKVGSRELKDSYYQEATDKNDVTLGEES